MPKILIEIDPKEQVVVPRDELVKISDWLYRSANIQQHSFDEPPEPASQFDYELVCASNDLAMLAAAPQPEQPAPIPTADDVVCKQQAEPVAYGVKSNEESGFIFSLGFSKKLAENQCSLLGGHVVPLYTAPQAQPAKPQSNPTARDWEMKAQGIESVIHYVVSKSDQDVLRRCAEDKRAEGIRAAKQAQPAPTPTAWQPIETAPTDVLHVRGLWVCDDSGQPLSFVCDVGRIDDDGFFVDEFGNVHGWRAEDYTHWHPLEVPPAPGGSDE